MTKKKKTFEFEVPCSYHYCIEAETEEQARKIDSYELKEKIEIALEPETTIEQIKNGDL